MKRASKGPSEGRALLLRACLILAASAGPAQALPWALADTQEACRPLASCLAVPPWAVVRATAQDGTAQVTLSRQPENPYGAQLVVVTREAVRRGDALVARFSVRSSTPGAHVEFVFEEKGGDYEKSVVLPFYPGPGWTEVAVPFRAVNSYAPGRAHAVLRLASRAQTVELGRLRVDDHGPLPSLEGLPRTPVTYPGREEGAAWRAAAQERIERLRMSRLAVDVRDAKGRPLPGARVRVTQLSHAFGFGTAVNSRYLEGPDDADRARYREFVEDFFNKAVIENDLKWPDWENDGWQAAPPALSWLAEKGLRLRGHALVWPAWDRLPADLRALSASPDAVRRRVEAHIEEMGRAFPAIQEWDVVNEPCAGDSQLGVLGRDGGAGWLRAARAALPKAQLYVNDFGVLDEDPPHARCYEELIARLRAGGAPLDGIGLQAHFGWRLTPPGRLLEILDRFAALGLPLQVTELSVNLNDPVLQADYLRDVAIALFSHPAVQGVVLWGFWEGVHGDFNALVSRDWTPSPAFREWVRLVHARWKTLERGSADAQGRYAVRAFHGRYRVSAELGGGKAQTEVTLGPDGLLVPLTLD